MLQQNELKDEIKRVSEAIRNIFHIEGDLEEADVESLHNQLIECVEAVNERLSRCDDLLRKGLRGEAIQESEISPNLLDLVTELDFPEWDAWSDYVRQFSIPPQPDLLVDIAVVLNEAYTEAQPLDSLLRLHRLHALARSPLQDRISILRGIAIKDSDNHVWREDLKSYERSRLRQAEQELRKFRQERNIRALDELKRELADTAWLVPPSPKLVQQATTTYDQFRAEAARKKLETVEQEINAAFSDFNVRRAELARQEWDKYAEIVALSEDDDLFLRVAPAFDWLDQEADDEQRKLDYDRVLAGLENGLDNEALSRTDLMRLFNDVERFDETIPDRMQRRYSERLRTLDAGETRRGRLVLLASFSTIVLLGGITAVVIFWQLRSSQVRSACDNLAKLMAKDQITEAQDYYQRIETDTPFIAESNSMKKLHIELLQDVKEENGRKQRLRQYIDRAHALAATESTWEKLRSATRELKDAETIANHEHEFVEIKTAEGIVSREQTRLQDEVDGQFKNEVLKIGEILKRIEELDRTQLRDLRSRAEQLDRRSRVSVTAKQGSGISAIIKKLADRDQAFELIDRKRKAFDRIVREIGRSTTYRLALENYVRSLQAGNRVRDFQQVTKNELDFIVAVENWNALAKRWNRLSFGNPSGMGMAGTVILKEIGSTYRDFPSAKEALVLSDYIDSLARQYGSTPILDTLDELFKSPLFELMHVEFLEERRKIYFLNGPIRKNFKEIEIRALLSVHDDTDVKDMTIFKIHLRKFGTKHYADAPQVALAKQLTAFLARKATFEEKVCGALVFILDNREIDPLLKGFLLQEVIRISKPGSLYLAASELRNFEQSIGTAGSLRTVDWLDSQSLSVNQKRLAVSNILNKLREHPKDVYLKRIKPKVAKIHASKPVLAELSWIGSLMKNEGDSSWTCEFGKDIDSLSGELWTRHYTASNAGSFVRIGRLAQGAMQLDVARVGTQLEGRPVWLVRPTK